MHSSTTWRTHAKSAELETLEESQEACLLVCYDRWWVSCVVGAIANCKHPLRWKEAIAVSAIHWELIKKWGRQWQSANDTRTFEQSVFSKSHMTKNLENIIKNPMTPCIWRINKVCSRFHRNRQTDELIDRRTDRTVTRGTCAED